jgi:hypothetical protein
MIPKLKTSFSKKICKSLIRTISRQPRPPKPISLPSILPILSSSSEKKSDSTRKFIALGFGLAAITAKSDEKTQQTIAPAPVTADPTKKGTGLVNLETPAKAPVKTGKKKSEDPNYLPYPGPYEQIDHDSKECLEHIATFMGGRLQVLAGTQEKNKKIEIVMDVSASPMIQRTFHASNLALYASLGNDYQLTGKVSGGGRVEGSAVIMNTGLQGFSITPHFKINPGGSQYNSVSLDVNQKGADYHLSGSFDAKSLNATYLQTFNKTPDVACGLHLVAPVPITAASCILIPALRYRDVDSKTKIGDIYTLQYVSGQHTIFLSYVRKESNQLTIATQFFLVGQNRETGYAIATKFDMTKFLYQAKIASDGTVTVGCEYLVTPQVKLNLSGELVHGQNQPPGFGVGLTLLV